MYPMDVKLYRIQIIRGQEDVAREWLSFLDAHKAEGSKILKNEKAYFEAYFTAMEGDTMFVYMVFAANDVNFSNAAAGESKNPLDIKHFEYASQCVEPDKGAIIDCAFYMDNLEDLGKY